MRQFCSSAGKSLGVSLESLLHDQTADAIQRKLLSLLRGTLAAHSSTDASARYSRRGELPPLATHRRSGTFLKTTAASAPGPHPQLARAQVRAQSDPPPRVRTCCRRTIRWRCRGSGGGGAAVGARAAGDRGGHWGGGREARQGASGEPLPPPHSLSPPPPPPPSRLPARPSVCSAARLSVHQAGRTGCRTCLPGPLPDWLPLTLALALISELL